MQRCRSCGKRIIWARTKNLKTMPLEESEEGNIRLIDGIVSFVEPGTGPYLSHFATCPQAARHRKPKGAVQ